MRAVLALIRAPLFSTRKPIAYQVAVAYPLPQPSTLVGALTYSLTVAYGGVKGFSGDLYVKKCCENVLRGLIRAVAKPLSPISRSSFTLSRMRTLELSSDEVVKRIKRGKRIKDAMVREYFYGKIGLLYVFKDEELAMKASKALYLLERLGDTESCICVEEIRDIKLKSVGREGEVDTYTPFEWLEGISGSFSVEKMFPERFAVKPIRTRAEAAEELVDYVVPLCEVKGNVLKLSPYRVKTKEGYSVWKSEISSLKLSVVLPLG